MAININGLGGGPAASGTCDSSQVNATLQDRNKTQSQNATPSATDTISLTEVSRHLNQLEKKLEGLPVVDVQRVESARQAIRDGSYSFNPDTIARKFSQMESLLPA